MLYQSDDSQDDAIEASKLTDDERTLLKLYREMAERDRQYVRRVVEVLTSAFIRLVCYKKSPAE